jgi:MFS family permease
VRENTPTPQAWLGRDARLILAARGLRGFAEGFLGVLLAFVLADKGLALREVGLFLSAGVLGGAAYALGLNALVARFGAKSTLIVLTLLSAGFGALILIADSLPALMAFAFLGSLAGLGGAGGAGPAQPVEQAYLASLSAEEDRARLFGVYRFGATIAAALGGLAAGIPIWLERGFHIPVAQGQQAMVLAFAGCLIGVALLYAGLSPGGGPARSEQAQRNPFRLRSNRTLLGLNALFGIDQLGSSLTTAALMAYWFHTRFGLELDALATLSFTASLLGAASMYFSVKLAARIGYVRTMVFTHIPASSMLVALAFVSEPSVAIALWLGRGLLSQMDNPARDALTMTVVHEDERVAMASIHLLSRNTMGTIGPTVSTLMWTSLGAAAPILSGGLLKIGYDLALFAFFREVEAEEQADSKDAPR